MKLLDANIVIYALGREHPYRRSCRAIINQLAERPNDYAIDAEMLQEILYVFHRREETDRGVEAVTRLLDLSSEIIPIGGAVIEEAGRLLRRSPQLAVRDAVHAAVVFHHGLEGIISADRNFDRIGGLARYDPMDVAAKF